MVNGSPSPLGVASAGVQGLVAISPVRAIQHSRVGAETPGRSSGCRPPAAAGHPADRPGRRARPRDPERLVPLPDRRRGRRGRVWDGRRDRDGVRLVPAVRRVVRRAALHDDRRRPGGVAEPAVVPVRRDRHRAPCRAADRAGQRRRPERPRIPGAVPDQPDPGDRHEHGRRAAGHRRGARRRDPDGSGLDRARRDRSRSRGRRHGRWSASSAEDQRRPDTDSGRPAGTLGQGASLDRAPDG